MHVQSIQSNPHHETTLSACTLPLSIRAGSAKSKALWSQYHLCGLVALEGFLSAPALRQPHRIEWAHSTVRGRSTRCSTPLAVSNSHNISPRFRIHF